MRAARELVERAAHGSARAHLRDQHRLRPVRLAVDSRGADGGAAAAPAAESCVRCRRSLSGRRSFAPRCCCARTPSRRGTRARASRPSSSCSSAWAAASCHTSRVAARSARAAISRRSRTSPCRSSARARRGTTGELRAPAPTRSRPPVSSRRGSQRRRVSRSSTARSSWPRTGHSASFAPAGSRRWPTSRARSRSKRCRDRARASFRRSTGCARCAVKPSRRRTCCRLLEGLRDQRGAQVVRQGAGRLLAALRAAGARSRRAICSTTSKGRWRSSSMLRRTIRSCSSRTSSSSRTGTSTASRLHSRSTRWRWRARSSRTSPSAGSSGSSIRICPTACPPS